MTLRDTVDDAETARSMPGAWPRIVDAVTRNAAQPPGRERRSP